MRVVAALIVLAATACATPEEPDTATAEGDATIVPIRGLVEVNTSCQWVPQGTCYGVTNDGASIWPLGMGITSVQVMTRSGPNRLSNQQTTQLAFVVWNSNTVGRIFRIDNDTDQADWRAWMSNVMEARTFNILDTTAGSTGSPAGGPAPPPHPNVEGPLTFSIDYLSVVKRESTVIQNATNAFLTARAAGVD